jgi:hypothetical protein
MTAQARLAELLWERGAGTIDHPGGTLFDHVAEHAAGFLDEHGGFFRRSTGAWASMLSPNVLSLTPARSSDLTRRAGAELRPAVSAVNAERSVHQLPREAQQPGRRAAR